MKFTSLLLSTIIIALLSGCAAKVQTPKVLAPNSHEVTFIESSSSAEVMLRAKGIGSTIEEASMDARLAATWFVLFGGSNPMLQTAEEKDAFSSVSQSIYKSVSKYVAYDSGIKSKKKQNEKYILEHVLRLNVAMLREDLIKSGVTKDTEELLGENFDLPKIAVISSDGKNKNSASSVAVISEYLNDRDFEVKRLGGGSVDKVFLKIAQNISVDPIAAELYANALSSGSDIYVTVDVVTGSRSISGNEVRKASVSAHAFYTANGKEIGATTGHSQERSVSNYASIIAEASNDASDKLLNQITKSWKKESKKGKFYKVIVTTTDELVSQVDTPLYVALKGTCKKVTPNQTINNIFDYTLQCDTITNFKELEMEIRQNYNGPGQIFKEAAKGSFIVLKIANSESEEIIIE